MTPRAQRLVLGLLWLGLAAFTFLGLDHAFGDGDEAIHAAVLRNMMHSGDYLRMRWYGLVLWDRPLLPYWFAAPFASVLPGELGVRASSALASFATLACVYRMAVREWARPSVGAVAVLLLAGVPSYHDYTRALLSDPLFVLGTTVALWGALEAQRQRAGLYVAAIGIGWAFAAKSLAAAIPLLALAPWLVRGVRLHGDRSSMLRALALLCALALPYYVLGWLLGGDDFVRYHIVFNLLRRAHGGYVGLGGGALAYLRWIPGADGPLMSACLCTGTLAACWLGRKVPALALVGSFVLTVFVVLSLLGTRLPHYVLPIYPAAALAVAGTYAELSAHSELFRAPLRAALAPALALIVLLSARNYPGGREFLFERPYGKILGERARALTAPNDRIYAFEWYTMALGYYAERRVVLLTTHPERYAAVNHADGAIARAKLAALMPPLPAAAGTRILVAGSVRDLGSSPWFKVSDVLAAAPPYFLVRATLGASRAVAAR